MTEQSMVDRVKAAIEATEENLAECERLGNFLVPDFRALALARAAIEAMREPTFLMEMAGDCVVPFDFSIPSLVPERPTRALWQRMVDEALK